MYMYIILHDILYYTMTLNLTIALSLHTPNTGSKVTYDLRHRYCNKCKISVTTMCL